VNTCTCIISEIFYRFPSVLFIAIAPPLHPVKPGSVLGLLFIKNLLHNILRVIFIFFFVILITLLLLLFAFYDNLLYPFVLILFGGFPCTAPQIGIFVQPLPGHVGLVHLVRVRRLVPAVLLLSFLLPSRTTSPGLFLSLPNLHRLTGSLPAGLLQNSSASKLWFVPTASTFAAVVPFAPTANSTAALS